MPVIAVPTADQFFMNQEQSKPNLSYIKNHFYWEGHLSEEQALWILKKGTEVLCSEGNIIHVDAPTTGNVLLTILQAQVIIILTCWIISLWKYPWAIHKSTSTIVITSFRLPCHTCSTI